MPPLLLFGRQWRIATDDFVFPSVIELFIRGGWIVVISVVLGFHIQKLGSLKCLGTDLVSTSLYLVVSLVLLLLTCSNLLLLAMHSARGRMWEPPDRHPRRHVSTFLYVNIFFTLAECLWTLTGTFLAFKDLVRCADDLTERSVIVAVLVIIFLTYLLLFIKLVVALTAFRPFSTLHEGEERQRLLGTNRIPTVSSQEELNVWGLRCLMPCSSDENTVEAFKEIASLLSKVFHDADLVPSDIVAGLLLMHYKHTKERDLIADQYLFAPPSQGEREVDPSELCELKHYYRYAAAAYGYWWYVLDRPVANCCSLWPRLSCASCCCCLPCCKLSTGVVEGDTCCLCNKAAVLAMLQVEEEDLLVFDNRNHLQEVPYFMVADHQERSLVIAIRGTLSIHDMLTDLRGDADHMLCDAWEENFGLDAQFRGHKGMVEAARYVYQCLHGGLNTSGTTGVGNGHTTADADNNGGSNSNGGFAGSNDVHVDGTCYGPSVPSSAASSSNSSSRDRATAGRRHSRARRVNVLGLALAQYPEYSIVVTGHSLGAGTATILTFLLRCRYPERLVRCMAYSPPGGLLSAEAAAESEKFTLALVLGDDVIPRTSLANIARLSRDIKAACAGCQLPKYKLLGHGLLSLCCCIRSSTIQSEVNRLFPVDDQLQQQPPGQTFGPGPPPSATVITFQDLPALEPDRLPGTPSSNGSANSNRQLLLLSPVHQPLVVAAVAAGHLALPLHQHEPLVLPGRIYYIEKPHGLDTFRVRVVDRSEFTDILVSPRMLLDHLPNYISSVLTQI